MLGVVLAAVGDFVNENGKQDTIKLLVCELDNVGKIFANKDYCDETFLEIVGKLAQSEGVKVSELLEMFGQYFISWAEPKYKFAFAAPSSKEFLLLMNSAHKSVKMLNPEGNPPTFEYEDNKKNELVMSYRSKRKLCPLVRGMILGVAARYDEKVDVEETKCMLKGDENCRFELSFS